MDWRNWVIGILGTIVLAGGAWFFVNLYNKTEINETEISGNINAVIEMKTSVDLIPQITATQVEHSKKLVRIETVMDGLVADVDEMKVDIGEIKQALNENDKILNEIYHLLAIRDKRDVVSNLSDAD